jgi:hypothetical protein
MVRKPLGSGGIPSLRGLQGGQPRRTGLGSKPASRVSIERVVGGKPSPMRARQLIEKEVEIGMKLYEARKKIVKTWPDAFDDFEVEVGG